MKKRNNIMPTIVVDALDKFAYELKKNGFKNIKCLNLDDDTKDDNNSYCVDWVDGSGDNKAFILEYKNTTLSIIYDDIRIPPSIKYIKFRPNTDLLSISCYAYYVLDLTPIWKYDHNPIRIPHGADENIKVILSYLMQYFTEKRYYYIANLIHELDCFINYHISGVFYVEDDYYMISNEQMVHNISLLEKILDMFNHFDKDDWDDLSIDNNSETIYDSEDGITTPVKHYTKDYTYKNAFTLRVSYTGNPYKNASIEGVLLFPDIKNNKNFYFDCYIPLFYNCIDDGLKANILNKIITLLKNENKNIYSKNVEMEQNVLNIIDEYYKSKKEK